MTCYCVSRKKLIIREKTKPQTATVTSTSLCFQKGHLLRELNLIMIVQCTINISELF